MEPLPKENRHPADYRDELEHAEVAAALSELPDDHPARAAYSTGALSDSIALTHLVKDRRDISERLVAAYLSHNARIWAKHRGGAHVAGKPAQR
ncbi:MAG TPA: hypothetical protein VNP36_03515 [Burkholderiales bacterium]|nr:hypothetical protein [Burkholderiales bacterium]